MGENIVVEAIGICSIVMKVMVKDKINIVHIMMLHVQKLQTNLLLVSKLLSNELIVQFNIIKYVMRGPDEEVHAIKPRKAFFTK